MERKKLTLIPIGGLANRLYAITSAIAFCEDHDIDLKVVWFKDWGMGADFHALFELAGNHPHVEIVDATWKDYIYDRPRKRNFWLPYLYQLFAFEKRFYEKQLYDQFSIQDLLDAFNTSCCIYLVHCNMFYKSGFSQIIIPKFRIEQRIKARLSSIKYLGYLVGVHIRRTDNIDSILKSPLSLFIEKMDKCLNENPNTIFYVASDALNEKKQLLDRYGNHVITDMSETSRDNLQGIENAVIDLFSLAKASKIYGSAYSSFSTFAAFLGDAPIEIIDQEKSN